MRGALVLRVILAICLIKATIAIKNERNPFIQETTDKQTNRNTDIQCKTKHSKNQPYPLLYSKERKTTKSFNTEYTENRLLKKSYLEQYYECMKAFKYKTSSVKQDCLELQWLHMKNENYSSRLKRDTSAYSESPPKETERRGVFVDEFVNFTDLTKPLTGPKIRKEFRALSDVERENLKEAFRKVYKAGYINKFADAHSEAGVDIHLGASFLPWHRAFLAYFEECLRKFCPTCTLPYWDSTIEQHFSEVHNVSAATSELFHIDFLGASHGTNVEGSISHKWLVRGDPDIPVIRDVGRKGRPIHKDTIDSVLQSCGITNFHEALEYAHNGVHAWIGGQMSSYLSPYDPVFYFHHCYVDYIWEKARRNQLNCNPPIDPRTDYVFVEEGDRPTFLPDAPMPYMEFLINMDGVRDWWILPTWVTYEDSPSCEDTFECSQPPHNRKGKYLYCHPDTSRCLPRKNHYIEQFEMGTKNLYTTTDTSKSNDDTIEDDAVLPDVILSSDENDISNSDDTAHISSDDKNSVKIKYKASVGNNIKAKIRSNYKAKVNTNAKSSLSTNAKNSVSSNDSDRVSSSDKKRVSSNVNDSLSGNDNDSVSTNDKNSVSSNGIDSVSSNGKDSVSSNDKDKVSSNGNDRVSSNDKDRLSSNGKKSVNSKYKAGVSTNIKAKVSSNYMAKVKSNAKIIVEKSVSINNKSSESSNDKDSVSSNDKDSVRSNDKDSVSSNDKDSVRSNDKDSVSSNDKVSVNNNDKASVSSDNKVSVNNNDKASVSSDNKVSVNNNDKASVSSDNKVSVNNNDKASVSSDNKVSVNNNDKASLSRNDKESVNNNNSTSDSSEDIVTN